MSRSAGTGSPVWFLCPVERRERNAFRNEPWRIGNHRITVTGQTKLYTKKRGSAPGLRSSRLQREYDCSCGHHGWSNHIDLARMTY